MRSRVWSTRSGALALAGAVFLIIGLVGLTWWLLGKTDGGDGAGIANVLALPATVVGAALAALGLRFRPHADDPALLEVAARRLLTAVTTAEARTLAQLLGDTGEPRPANVPFEAVMLHWRADGGDQTGSLATIASYYASLNRGRLAILGEAGAGKTVLALRLLLDLAATDGTIRVPVRLSLPAFVADSVVTRERLDSWIAGHLSEIYRLRPAVARALVTDGWILPILDGLDEMDPDDDEPIRAAQVLAALNEPSGPAPGPVVITCRTKRYHQLAATEPLQDATAITLQALGVEEVVTWLAHRFPDPNQPDGIQRRWRSVVTTIRDHPGGRLARCLTSPLRLYLAITVYQHPDSKPKVLCTLHAVALDQHLLSELIPAVAKHHPRPDRTHYDRDDVERWLETLAKHLSKMADLGYSGVDLYLHELWRTTGDPPGNRVRHLAAALCAATIAVPAALSGIGYASRTGVWIPTRSAEMIPVLAALALPVLVYRLVDTAKLLHPSRLDVHRIRTPQGRRFLVAGLAVGGVGGFIAGLGAILLNRLLSELTDGLAHQIVDGRTGVIAGTLGGAVIGALAIGLGADQQASRPTDPLRQGIAWSATYGITIWLIVGPPFVLATGFATGMLIGLTAAFGFGVGVLSDWLPRYALAVHSLSRTGDLPFRLGRFLDWAHRAGLVRLAGTAIQFRHRDLQTYLSNPPTKVAVGVG